MLRLGRLGHRLLRPAAVATSVAAAGSTLLSQRASAQADTAKSGSSSPFDDPELNQALPERIVRQKIMLEYLSAVLPRVRRAMATGGEAGAAEVRVLQEEMAGKQEAILFDALPGERRRYLVQHGCAAWTSEGLAVCASHTPLVEIGAGAGQWARALASLGVDVAAYDDGSEVPQAVRGVNTADIVQHGGAEALKLGTLI